MAKLSQVNKSGGFIHLRKFDHLFFILYSFKGKSV